MRAAVEEALEAAGGAIGGEPADIVVCLAPQPAPTPFAALDDVAYDAAVAGPLAAIFAAIRGALGPMRATGSGDVVVVGSTRGLRPRGGEAAQAVLGAALAGLCRSMAAELQPLGVRVTLLAVGRTGSVERAGRQTAGPASPLLTPADVADAVLAALCLPPAVSLGLGVVTAAGASLDA